VVPADADLTARSASITAWADVDDAMRPVLARQMEVYAGFLEYADHHAGRVIDALEELGILDDTLVYYIIGDNGASAEGGPLGTPVCPCSRATPRRRAASPGRSPGARSISATTTTTTSSTRRTISRRR
jgi:arylsulfatase A-like enzyme